jgi:hypothetical protein
MAWNDLETQTRDQEFRLRTFRSRLRVYLYKLGLTDLVDVAGGLFVRDRRGGAPVFLAGLTVFLEGIGLGLDAWSARPAVDGTGLYLFVRPYVFSDPNEPRWVYKVDGDFVFILAAPPENQAALNVVLSSASTGRQAVAFRAIKTLADTVMAEAKDVALVGAAGWTKDQIEAWVKNDVDRGRKLIEIVRKLIKVEEYRKDDAIRDAKNLGPTEGSIAQWATENKLAAYRAVKPVAERYYPDVDISVKLRDLVGADDDVLGADDDVLGVDDDDVLGVDDDDVLGVDDDDVLGDDLDDELDEGMFP